ncbi:variant erythrocyte surface antigen-1, beta subunit [Babesia caballi]|uniref:Variant erythrocyte surface antigen-1, beta subunit n=1 Tax=Babesia caballi TaxID=5871 RepID=A0AAV4LPV7_BABCB|nr:variant erythrocyte surface antigen-1, beta subunit [Babesia caballi]
MAEGPKTTGRTEPPTNLKEAIDWVVRISGHDFRNGYQSGGKTAIRKLAMNLISENNSDLTKLAEVMHKALQYTVNHSGIVGDGLRKLFDGVEIDMRAIQTSDFSKWLSGPAISWLKDDIQSYDGPITAFAKGLAKFIGWDEKDGGTINCYGIASCFYRSAYDKHSDPGRLSGSTEAEAISIFVDAVISTFLLLTFLFWKCHRQHAKESCVECGEWSRQTFCDEKSEVGIFLKAAGFKDFRQLTTCSTVEPPQKLKASVIAGRLSYAFPEFSRVMAAFMGQRYPTHEEFISTLIKGVMYESGYLKKNEEVKAPVDRDTRNATLTPQHFPFTALFIIASAYQEKNKSSTTVTVLKTVGGLVVGGAVGGAAYSSLLSFFPALASIT